MCRSNIKSNQIIILDPKQELTKYLEEDGYKIVKLKVKEDKHGTDRQDEADA